MKKKVNSGKIHLISLLLILMGAQAHAKEKLFIPSHPQSHAALFVAMHGCLSTAQESEQTTRLSVFAEKYGFYVLYPEPALGADSRGCFDFYSTESQRLGGGDAEVIVSKIKGLLKTYDLDDQKVFVVGMSGGASLVSVLTSCYPEVFHGAVIHSGMGFGLATNWQESLFVAQFGPIPYRERNKVCNPSDYKGKLLLVQGSRDQVMNPRHYSTLKKDYFSNTTMTSKAVASQSYQYGFIHERFYQNNQLRGHGIFVLGLNHEWSGPDPINPFGPRGPDISQIMIDYFLKDYP